MFERTRGMASTTSAEKWKQHEQNLGNLEQFRKICEFLKTWKKQSENRPGDHDTLASLATLNSQV